MEKAEGNRSAGPVAALYRFESESEVIQRSNDTDVGLSGYFFSRDIGRIWRVAEALEVGMVGIKWILGAFITGAKLSLRSLQHWSYL